MDLVVPRPDDGGMPPHPASSSPGTHHALGALWLEHSWERPVVVDVLGRWVEVAAVLCPKLRPGVCTGGDATSAPGCMLGLWQGVVNARAPSPPRSCWHVCRRSAFPCSSTEVAGCFPPQCKRPSMAPSLLCCEEAGHGNLSEGPQSLRRAFRRVVCAAPTPSPSSRHHALVPLL